MKLFLESNNLLETITSEAEKNNREAELLVEGLTQQQLNWKPYESQWSMAQCLDHLAVTTKAWEQIFADAIRRGRQKYAVAGSPRYSPTIVGGWLIKNAGPELKRKFPAPKVFRPTDGSNIQNALQTFLDSQTRFLNFVKDSHGLDYNKTRLRSPVTPLMRYSLADAFVVIVVHNQRHLAQARRVRELPNFPTTENSKAQSA